MSNGYWLESALKYAADGYSLIPVGINKVSLVTWKEYQTKRATESELQTWATQYPNSMLAVVTGKGSNLVIVDIDKGGLDSLKQLEKEGLITQEQMRTPQVITQGGGRHYWFAYPKGVDHVPTMAGIRKGIDIRGDGGYAVIPPSEVMGTGKKYGWRNGLALSDLPKKDLIPGVYIKAAPAKAAKVAPSHLASLLAPKDVTERHAAMLSLIGHWIAINEHREVAWANIQNWNLQNTEPETDGELEYQFNDMWDRWGKSEALGIQLEELCSELDKSDESEWKQTIMQAVEGLKLPKIDFIKWQEHLKDNYKFPKSLFNGLVSKESFTEELDFDPEPEPLLPEERVALEKRASALLHTPAEMHLAIHAIEDSGVVGERRNIGLIRLAVRSRVLERPINLQILSASSSGKTHMVRGVLAFEYFMAYMSITAGSERSLIYIQETMRRRMLYIQEPEGIPKEVGNSILRALIWEGSLTYRVTIWDSGKPKVLNINKKGPTGLILTTTIKMEEQISNRMFIIETDVSEEQTKRIVRLISQSKNSQHPVVDFEPWHALSRLTGEETRVEIHFGEYVDKHINTKPVRVRRDWTLFLNLIEASAVEYQYQRQVAPDGRIQATVADYAHAISLGGIAFKTVQTGEITDSAREFMAHVTKLVAANEKPATTSQLSALLGVSNKTIKSRADDLIASGWLVDYKGPAKKDGHLYEPGAVLPDAPPPLPTPCELSNHLAAQGREDLVVPWVDPVSGLYYDCKSHLSINSTEENNTSSSPPSECLPSSQACPRCANTGAESLGVPIPKLSQATPKLPSDSQATPKLGTPVTGAKQGSLGAWEPKSGGAKGNKYMPEGLI